MSCEWGAVFSVEAAMGPVAAGELLSAGTQGANVSIATVAAIKPFPTQIKVSVNVGVNGRLSCSDDRRLVQSVRLSEDFHCCNTVLERGTDSTVFLTTTKDINKGEPLTLWFSTGIQAALGIPFLSPFNIQGEKNYLCHICRKSFEFPNPLKIHLLLDCEKRKMIYLWKKLKDSINNNSNCDVPYESILKLSLKTASCESDSTSDSDVCPPSPSFSYYSNPSPKREKPEDKRPSSEPPRNSAFTPYFHFKQEKMNEQKSSPVSFHRDDHRFIGHTHGLKFNEETFLNKKAAEIETLVSNLGQSKQGHLCLYCGKIYSRKYGLKIHIRTHTGFKPLKCKYCLRPFGDPSNLNKHVRLHAEGETPYRCDLCGKMLVRRRDLDRHMKSRHNVYDYR